MYDTARAAADTRRTVRALLAVGRSLFHHNHRDEALARYGEAEALASGLDDAALSGACDRHLSVVLGTCGRCEEALQRARAARSSFEAAGAPLAIADALRGEGAILKQLGRLDEAGERLARAVASFHAQGTRLGEADCLHDLAELQRLRGELDDADVSYRRAGALYEALGSAHVSYVHCNRALLLSERGDHAAVATLVDRHLPELYASAVDLLRIGARLVRAAAAAALADWPTWDLRFDEAVRLLSETATVERDVARTADRAADLAEMAGETARASQARALARSQWSALGG